MRIHGIYMYDVWECAVHVCGSVRELVNLCVCVCVCVRVCVFIL